ncbi:hypothetical protein LBMAG53_20720 [Planctomycetota bacterium]|nr:hypothetical protein LBMAG53_20720 [Planctomycetota bacterium]
MRLTALLACCSALVAADPAEKPIKHTEIQGMNNFIGLRYLPDDRYSGDAVSPRGDYEMLLSVHVPKEGKGPFPVVIYVHGGSYTSYNKEGQTELAKELAGRGIAFCGFNYVLKPKGIFPQCWWDFPNAVRFLRKNAATYNIDPLRIGAYGISAGGWLISSAAMANGDHAATRMQGGSVHLPSFFAKNNGVLVTKNQDDEWAWLKPIRDPAPAWPGESGGVSALSWDFCYFVERGDRASPAVQQWAGQGAAKPGYADAFVAAGGRLTITDLTDQKFAGKGVHVPPFFNRGGGKGEADALDLDGKPGKTLGAVVADFFVRELASPSARVPAPEVFPVPHLISGPAPVTLVAPRGATIRYTTDGTTPTETSLEYKSPFSVAPGTTVQAIAIAPGMQSSGAIKAEFINAAPAPTVTGPESLPPGETGKPYSATFTANQAKVRWNMQGDLVAFVAGGKKNTVYSKDDYTYPNHMRLDADTGVWSGTPTRPGSFWIQVWVAGGPGMLGGYRNYRWTVSGKDLGDQAPAAVEAADRNQVFATLKHWPAEPATALLDAFSAAKLRVLTPGKVGDPALLLVVHADDRTKAETLLKDFSAKRPELSVSIESAKP